MGLLMLGSSFYEYKAHVSAEFRFRAVRNPRLRRLRTCASHRKTILCAVADSSRLQNIHTKVLKIKFDSTHKGKSAQINFSFSDIRDIRPGGFFLPDIDLRILADEAPLMTYIN